jgi:5'-nucleotidase
MKILITNDDGVQADGINILFKELSKHHKVLLLAPDREQSAASHSLTLARPLRMHKYAADYYSCDGTPTDSVLLAVLNILNHKRPDMVISGINHGANMGEDVMYSGTVAAAVEGSLLGIPAIAVSMVDSVGADFKAAARFVRRFIKLYPNLNLGPSTILNINLPGKVRGGFNKYEFTRLGTRQYDDIIVAKTDPRGLEYYWIAGSPIWKNVMGSDIYAIRKGIVSITPIHMHFTDSEVLKYLRAQDLKLPR